jgi:hypothetical protein
MVYSLIYHQERPQQPNHSSITLASIVIAFLTIVDVVPELGYFLDKIGKTPPTVTVEELAVHLSASGLYNMKILGDFLLGKDTTSNPFNTPEFLKYVKYVMIQSTNGLGGMFVYKSPKEFIEGYTDAKLMATVILKK